MALSCDGDGVAITGDDGGSSVVVNQRYSVRKLVVVERVIGNGGGVHIGWGDQFDKVIQKNSWNLEVMLMLLMLFGIELEPGARELESHQACQAGHMQPFDHCLY
ncbi:hypothetical protein F0562_033630 [Nyssa sinensis]|uniref:Uncharacterized protein n=1 Tax=Nyssa sinensis TaxID=561372 RepID=A0A5J5AKB3_9ASTE|nr:hypothetical protein F0562_033630 [Nyssa sinensis]